MSSWVPLTLLLSGLGAVVDGRGAMSNEEEERPNADNIQWYQPNPRDPVPFTNRLARMEGSNFSGAFEPYENYNLNYFGRYYLQYRPHIRTDTFKQHQASLNKDSNVCVNYHVRALVRTYNETYMLIMGAFTCPLPFEQEDFTMCCGEEFAEFCCFPLDHVNEEQTKGSLCLGAILLAMVLMGVGGYCCLGKQPSSGS